MNGNSFCCSFNQTQNSSTFSPQSTYLTPKAGDSTNQSLLDLDSPITIQRTRSSFYAKRKEKLSRLDLSFNSPQLKPTHLNNDISQLRCQLIGMIGITLENSCEQKKFDKQTLSRYAVKKHQKQDPKPFSRKFDDIYELGRKIGEGGNSVVKECFIKHVNLDESQKAKYAVKIVKFSDTEQLFNIIEEQRIMNMLKHQNIVELIDFFIDKNKHSVQLVMEYCEGKSLTKLIQKRHPFSQEEVKYITRTLLKSLHYIHLKGICHRDLSNNNVIFDVNTRKVKLIDFSVSKEYRNKHRKMWTKTGTLQFVAPESIMEENDGYNPKIDIWSIGVIMFSLLTGDLPFIDPNDSELGLIDLIIHSEPDYEKYMANNQISPEAYNLLTKLLEKDPKNRITLRDALQHEWLEEKIERIQVIHNQDKIIKFMKSPLFKSSKPKGSDQLRTDYFNSKQKSLNLKKQPSFSPPAIDQNTKNANIDNNDAEYHFSPRSKVISIGNPISLCFQHHQHFEAK
ncbi:Serine/Threonine kinase domain protein (macronuclear) [Tetrahymena thermophila SB210]|uniref:Serine/Threonine kinase domain protein n=1 Tax=Tetrahymena thermophila (strain SB210) TaxID=312017 RepID=I7MAG1_TETTS|nr:Serine/Threonine kinase domain protein [Tetrahymena thermophila SB210]EAS04526.2 Serine/Threonine kinase domain protein [Tetrahymena thermophila SB210]|eukprot:XP_001024771.2 Serine/Threonine kinase domain protein [Tetrahymena thermophila SB210]